MSAAVRCSVSRMAARVQRLGAQGDPGNLWGQHLMGVYTVRACDECCCVMQVSRVAASFWVAIITDYWKEFDGSIVQQGGQRFGVQGGPANLWGQHLLQQGLVLLPLLSQALVQGLLLRHQLCQLLINILQ